MSGLAQMYDLKDENQAKEYLEKVGIEYRFQCFHEKLPDGCHRLADFLEAFRKDYEKAGTVFMENCEKNKYGHSCFKYGHYKFTGNGCDKDIAEAVKYYEMACDNKYYSGCYNSGMLYLKGKVKPTFTSISHEVKAMNLLKSGCEGNEAKCCHQLSAFYILGKHSLNRNMEKAFKYAKKACDLGHIHACANVSRMYRRGEGIEKNEALADKFKEHAQKLTKDARENVVEMEFQKTS